MNRTPYQEQVRAELIASISRDAKRSRSFVRPIPMLLGTASAMLIAGAVVFALSRQGPSQDTGTNPASPHVAAKAPRDSHARPRSVKQAIAQAAPVIDPGDRVTLAQAERDAPFDVLVPNSAAANSDNSTGVFEGPSDDQGPIDIEMRFPPPTSSSADVRQPYVSVSESAWPDGWVARGQSTDPLDYYQQDLAASPDSGAKSICFVGDRPALCVEPRSQSDMAQANPAYVHLVIDNVSIEVSGGDSLPALIDIAKSLAPAPSPGN
jgi:hypothetical protein